MNLSFWFARKYFYTRKVKNVINIISLISQLGITICAAALIIVLSVFNGLEDLMISLYNSFDSDFKITPIEGKYFEVDSIQNEKLVNLQDLVGFTGVIEENALIEYDETQTIATIKAISPEYLDLTGLDSMMVYGDVILQDEEFDYAILGYGVASKLDLIYFDYSKSLHIYFPKKGRGSFILNPSSAFNSRNILPVGIFSIQEDFDSKYIIVPIDFMRKLVLQGNKVTSVEINFAKGTKLAEKKLILERIFGDNFNVKDREEQHASLYRITRLEKYMTFIILSFILLIAAFNLIGSLLMLSLEKKKDMMVLKSMGAQSGMIRKIFFYEGLLLSFSSAVIGILLGMLITWLQMQFGLVGLGGDGSTFIVDAYPVKLRGMDVLLVFVVVILIGFVSSYLPARSAQKDLTVKDLHK